MRLHVYWLVPARDNSVPYAAIGVTAWSENDALGLVANHIFAGVDMPAIAQLIEDVDLESLDANHVKPNMGNPLQRGVWFPLGFGVFP